MAEHAGKANAAYTDGAEREEKAVIGEWRKEGNTQSPTGHSIHYGMQGRGQEKIGPYTPVGFAHKLITRRE